MFFKKIKNIFLSYFFIFNISIDQWKAYKKYWFNFFYAKSILKNKSYYNIKYALSYLGFKVQLELV